ncbi:MAG: NAD(P)-dependent oxidoreductase, partial [Sinomonas sp.]|nr:NAD(P)-dependent oxidoreductase [Sinomonas sp.]
MRCTIIGLGEAGRIYASALQGRGHDVLGYDVAPIPTPNLRRAASMAEAVGQADAVIVMTTARASLPVARDAAPHLGPGTLYADFTSAAPSAKVALTEVLPAGVLTADIAILGPVISLGASTPLMAAGPGAERVAELLRPVGAPVEVVHGELGDAMAHKLLRSIVMKGFAAVICEAVEAGRRAGYEDWVRGQFAAVLSGDGQSTFDRFITGSAKHAAR